MEKRGFSVKRAAFAVTALVGSLLLAVGIAWLFLPTLKACVRSQLVNVVALTLSGAERRELAAEAVAGVGDYWDAIPEPLVNRVAKRGYQGISRKAQIRINNAGMRCTKQFEKKSDDTYRIVCLGDSFVFGTAGTEEDRFCDQIGRLYEDNGIRVGGQHIETLAVGLEGWTALQEASYLSSRLSSYDPDVIIMLAVPNDSTDSFGVDGHGVMTSAFSPEFRRLGSGVYSNQIGRLFGYGPRTAMGVIGLSLEGNRRWTMAMNSLSRLVDLQSRRHRHTLLSVLDWSGVRTDPFTEDYVTSLRTFEIQAPYIVTSFFPGDEGTRLPHDGHPNKLGHRIMADQYMATLHTLGWVPIPDRLLPALDPRLTTEISPDPKTEVISKERRRITKRLRTAIDFRHLSGDETWGFLGGIFPEETGRIRDGAPPWASVSSAFLLRSPVSQQATRLFLSVSVPPRDELFPFVLTLYLNGERAQELRLETPTGVVQHLEADMPRNQGNDGIVEVRLETESYFCEIDDHRMKSFQLISAAVVAQ